jgi:SGNH hydrolase-like domain, acetyltransferase AlgX
MRIATRFLTLVVSLAFVSFVYQQAVVEGAFGPAAMLGTAALGLLVVAMLVLTYLTGTRHRELVSNLMLALTSVVVCYLALDLAAGWILIGTLSPPLVPHPYRHHAMVPDSQAEIRQRDFAYIQRVNHLGLRGRETTVEKPAGTRRILMLGDSFTMGKGVEDDQTFSVLVERALQASLAACAGGAVEVVNGGIDSYAPILSRLQFERELARLAPDLVVLNFDNSDLIQEAAYRQQAVRGATGEIVAVPQVGHDSLYERFVSWTSRHLFFTRVLLVYINRAMDHRELTVRRVVNEAGREHFAHTLEGDVDRTAQWNDVFESIGRIKRLADSLPAEFLLTTYPWAHQLGDRGWVPGRYAFMKKGERTTDVTERTIRERSAALGIDLFESLPVFQHYQGAEALYFDYDPHWTPAGHRVMAEGLAQHIAERQLPHWCARK